MGYKKNKRKRNGKRQKEHNGAGSFSCYEHTDGSKTLCYTFSYKDANGKTKRKSVTGYSENECIQKKEEFLKKQLSNLPENLQNATIIQLIQIQREINIKLGKCNVCGDMRNASTQKIFEKLPIENPIGLIPIKDITADMIESFKIELPLRYSQSVIKKIFIQLRQAFDYAKRKGIIENNLLDDPQLNTVPVSKKETKTVTAYTREEEIEFFNLLDNKKIRKNENDYRLQLHISACTGMRMGEINALTVESVDLDKKIVHITRTISRGENYTPTLKEGTKTKKGKRDVPITQTSLPYFQEALNNYKENKEHLLFYNHNNDTYITTQQVNDWTRRFCEKNGIRFDGVHMLRHTFATNCARNKMPITILAEILGHEDTKITNKYYITINNEDKAKALEEAMQCLENNIADTKNMNNNY